MYIKFHFFTYLQYKATNSPTVFHLSNISWTQMCILFALLFSSSSNNEAVQARSLNENCLNVALIAWIYHNQRMNEWYRKILSFLCSYMGKIEDGNWMI